MIRFRIKELIEECIAELPEGQRLHMQVVADAIGVPRSTLAGLTSYTQEPVTNTTTVEGLCRFFQLHHPRFRVGMLFEFSPPLSETTELRVDRLYPERTRKGREYRRNRAR